MGTINYDDLNNSNELEGQIRATAESRQTLVVSWDLIKTAGISDKSHSTLLYAITEDSDDVWDESISEP